MSQEEHDIKIREMVLRVAKKHLESEIKNIPDKISGKDNQNLVMSLLKQLVDENPLVIAHLGDIIGDLHSGLEDVIGCKFEVEMPEEYNAKS